MRTAFKIPIVAVVAAADGLGFSGSGGCPAGPHPDTVSAPGVRGLP
jgi:hypothetical protein